MENGCIIYVWIGKDVTEGNRRDVLRDLRVSKPTIPGILPHMSTSQKY